MLDASDFALPEDPPKREKDLEEKLKCAADTATKLVILAKEAKEDAEGARGSFQAGMALAYFVAFKNMSTALGLDYKKYPFVMRLFEDIKKLVPGRGEGPTKTVVVEHRRDKDGLKVEAEKVEVRKAEVRRLEAMRGQEEEPKEETSEDSILRDLIKALSGPTLGYPKPQAVELAKKVWRPGATLEELIGDACRVGI